MTHPASAHFFSDLPVQRLTLSQLFGDTSCFSSVPGDWHVIVTDIENSTAAVDAGRHDDVNLIATGSIIATLNIAHRSDLLIPFFFGGDGATLIVPPALLESALASLAAHRNNTRNNFGLELRVGSVPVKDLYSAGHELGISRLFLSEHFAIPVVLGHGLAEAERIIKGIDGPDELIPSDALELQGMECRWDRIEPANTSHEVVSLLVVSLAEKNQAPAFKRVIDHIDRIYGSEESRNPVSVPRLRLNGTFAKLRTEIKARTGRIDPWDLIRAWLATRIGGRYFMRSASGKRYLAQLVDLTDTLVIDGRINTVIAGTAEQRERLEAGLQDLEEEGLIFYGLAVGRESVMSCYVSDRTDKHIHFVDGADGGYTLAAGVLKRKLRLYAAQDSAGGA